MARRILQDFENGMLSTVNQIDVATWSKLPLKLQHGDSLCCAL